VTITISLEEFHRLASRADDLADRLRSARFEFERFAQVRPSTGAAHALEQCARQGQSLESLAVKLRALAEQYHGGESLVVTALGRLVLGLTPLAVVFTWLGTTAGVLPSGRVTLTSGEVTACVPPIGFAQLLERIPQESNQVRIESFLEQGQRRFIVYIAGTADFEPHVSRNPWDMTSNLQALSDVAMADSEAAVRQAMRQAGIDSATPVVLVGHSQGGLIASRIAASGDFNVTDAVLAGSPSHRVSIPDRVRVTAFEHSEDLIPALSGPVLSGVTAGALMVRQRAPELGRGVNLPAHDLRGYVATARETDASTNPVVSSRREAVTRHPTTCEGREYQSARAR
jgi:hypothetical protein